MDIDINQAQLIQNDLLHQFEAFNITQLHQVLVEKHCQVGCKYY